MNSILQVVFNFKPEEKDSFLGISYDGWFTGLVPVLLFIVGYLINKWIENLKEKKRLREVEEYFNQLIILLKKPLERQVKGFLIAGKLLKSNKDQHFYLDDVTNFHVDQIKEISNKDLFTIYIKGKKSSITNKTELFGKLKASIDLIDNTKKQLRGIVEKFIQSFEKNEEEFKKNMGITDAGFNAMYSRSASAKLLNQDFFLQGLDEIRATWHKGDYGENLYTDRYIAVHNYLEPLRKLCVEHMHDERASFMLNHVMMALHAFDNIEEGKKVFRRHFIKDARNLQSSYFTIIETLKKFKTISK